VWIETELKHPMLLDRGTTVSLAVLPPRFESPGGVRVQLFNDRDLMIDQYSRSDPRIAFREGAPSITQPDGTRMLFNSEVLSALRRMRVLSVEGVRIAEFDLGPAIVNGCDSGLIPSEMCKTFDSDSDGCRDSTDPQPLSVESTPPHLEVSVTPTTLWPPNHRMVSIALAASILDNCDAAPVFVLSSIASNQPDDAKGDGNTTGDISGADVGTPDLAFELRAERSGKAERTYRIVYTARDRNGNVSEVVRNIVVPKSAPKAK